MEGRLANQTLEPETRASPLPLRGSHWTVIYHPQLYYLDVVPTITTLALMQGWKMESRGDNTDKRAKGRPAIGRRSCDQCRSRKIGCDRGSPCSNCISARLNCTHSAITSSAPAPKQRVLISAQYEQKIDGIARDIDDIKLLLQGLNLRPAEKQPDNSSGLHLNRAGSMKPLNEHQSTSPPSSEPLWDHSAHMIDFVKAVVKGKSLTDVGPEVSEVFSSLSKLVQTLEGPAAIHNLSFSDAKEAKHQIDPPPVPPLEDVVAVLRWAKDHEKNYRIAWISSILPLQQFTDICRKVYFAVDDYNEIDFILANSYLSYVFFEHVVVSGRQDYHGYSQLCRRNLHDALLRLPLLLPASMEVIAALTLGAFNAIENSKATMAWTFVSAASDLCQRLRYHRLPPMKANDPVLQSAQNAMFWTVYKMDKGLSLRLGRLSNIRDAEITLPPDPNAPRSVKVGRIQGMVYDQLYSPCGLSRPRGERGNLAKTLAGQLRELINEIHSEIFDATSQPSNYEKDPMRIFYLQCDLVCLSSLHSLILRAIPMEGGSSISGVSDDCVAVARNTLDIHEQCMRSVRGCKNNAAMVTRYMSWAIVHGPFVPFSILFTRAVQLLDVIELARLERFAASLQFEAAPSESTTHPYRLYKLLCQAARLYFDLNTNSLSTASTLVQDVPDSLGEFSFAHYGMEAGVTPSEIVETGGLQNYGLGDWYYGNQQIMNLLDEDLMY